MPDPIHEAIPLDGTAEDSSTARAAARSLLERAGCGDDLAGDALLCLSELVTNAILHAGGSICVELTATSTTVRLEVTDGVAPEADLASTQGRGLAIVEQLARDWGVVDADAEGRPGKKVWAELVAARGDDIRDRAPTTASATSEAVLLDVPIRLFLASEAHLDALLRDVQLLAADWTSRNDPLVKGLADALRRNHDARFAWRDEVQRRLEAGDVVLTLRFPVDDDTPARTREFVDVVTRCEVRTGRGDDVTDPLAAELRHFRRWYAAELTHQALGGAPRRCPFRP